MRRFLHIFIGENRYFGFVCFTFSFHFSQQLLEWLRAPLQTYWSVEYTIISNKRVPISLPPVTGTHISIPDIRNKIIYKQHKKQWWQPAPCLTPLTLSKVSVTVQRLTFTLLLFPYRFPARPVIFSLTPQDCLAYAAEVNETDKPTGACLVTSLALTQLSCIMYVRISPFWIPLVLL